MSKDKPARRLPTAQHDLMGKPYAWQAVGGTIWNHKTSEDDRPLYAKPQWQGLTERDVKTIVENAPSVEWAVLMTESTLKEKNGG